jgi:hypothetical protein
MAQEQCGLNSSAGATPRRSGPPTAATSPPRTGSNIRQHPDRNYRPKMTSAVAILSCDNALWWPLSVPKLPFAGTQLEAATCMQELAVDEFNLLASRESSTDEAKEEPAAVRATEFDGRAKALAVSQKKIADNLLIYAGRAWVRGGEPICVLALREGRRLGEMTVTSLDPDGTIAIPGRDAHFSAHPRATPSQILGDQNMETIASEIVESSNTASKRKEVYPRGITALAHVCVAKFPTQVWCARQSGAPPTYFWVHAVARPNLLSIYASLTLSTTGLFCS